VLHEGSGVCVAGDADTGNQLDLPDGVLREGVALAEVECEDRCHQPHAGLDELASSLQIPSEVGRCLPATGVDRSFSSHVVDAAGDDS
jgi:hypothetical protein